MLADELAEAVADLGAAVIAVHGLGRNLLRLPGGWGRFGERPDLLDRTDADAVSLAEGPVDRPGFRHPHLGAVDQGRDIGGIGIPKTDESFARS